MIKKKKSSPRFFLTAVGVLLALCCAACDTKEPGPGDSSESAPADGSQSAADTQPVSETEIPVDPENLNHFEIVLGDPVVVAQGPSFDDVGWYWGSFQFPALTRLNDGRIYCSFSNRPDSSTAYVYDSDIPNEYVSDDGGASWHEADGSLLPEGWETKVGFFAQNSYTDDSLSKYTPVYQSENGTCKLYYAKDVPEFDQTVSCYSYEKGKQVRWICDFIWDTMPVVVENGRIMPLSAWAALGSRQIVTPDGVRHFAMYSYGFDNETGEVANGWHYNLYIFRSEDGGHLWEYESQILTTAEFTEGQERPIEGFCEPCMNVMPDGSVVMLIRTDAGTPSYITRSTDNCLTWSKPVVFDEVGVLPQLLTLDCGVTLASYGRPGLFVRATDDPRGLIWADRVDLGIRGSMGSGDDAWAWFSCCYTSLIPLDSHTALLAYADFMYPSVTNPNATAKSILVRTVTVRYPGEEP